VIRPRDLHRAATLRAGLQKYSRTTRALPGIQSGASLQCLVEQLLESIRRIEFVSAVSTRPISPSRLDPASDNFDPVRGAILLHQRGSYEEACWMVFLFAHFGKHVRTGYQLTRDVYGKLGAGSVWDWKSISHAPGAFRKWLARNEKRLRSKPDRGYFGNHRKYLTLSDASDAGTGAAFATYVRWVKSFGSHKVLFDSALAESQADPGKAFDWLFVSMEVASFGRTGRFDYLTMIGKTGLAAIAPRIPYLQGATGPLQGGRLLLEGDRFAPLQWQLVESWLTDLGNALGIAMQVVEDAICNWQKSPDKFIAFRG
jgi:hypothetical protein